MSRRTRSREAVSGFSFEAEPPPPREPGLTAEHALNRFLANPCGSALGDFRVFRAELRAFGEGELPEVLLDLELRSPPSGLGVVYRVLTHVGLDPASGEVSEGDESAARLSALLGLLARARDSAEADPEVRRFIAEAWASSLIVATFEEWAGPGGRIVFDAGQRETDRLLFVWASGSE